ncbi:MAG: hypothetical protein AAFN92_16770, partial [Bacteroidota bacterium]
GSDRGDGTIQLNWEANTEVDLKGYQLFRCFARGGEFALVGDVITATEWSDDLTGTVINDSIYYRLAAMDERANVSPKTPVLVIARADVTPPSTPLLMRADPTPDGVAFKWAFSTDDDIVRHELQRRPTGTPDWVTILNVPAGAEGEYRNGDDAPDYLDETPLQRRRYDYQLLAFDDAGLGAGSQVLTLTPYDDGQRSAIEHINLIQECQDTVYDHALPSVTQEHIETSLATIQSVGDLTESERVNLYMDLRMHDLIISYEDKWRNYATYKIVERLELILLQTERVRITNCTVELKWFHDLDPDILHFQIYRSRRGSRLRPYKSLPTTYFAGQPGLGFNLLGWKDTDVEHGLRYVYKIGVVYRDGGFARQSAGVTVLVE